MIKASELQKGDWVKNDLGEIQQVAEIRSEGIMLAYGDIYKEEELEPVMITPEILEKSGFKKNKQATNYDLWVCVIAPYQTPQAVIEFRFFGDVISADTLLKCWTKPATCDGVNDIRICDLKFVHKLQHAIQLCGIEKDITI